MYKIIVCHNCPDRVVGCHAICEKYIRENEKAKEYREKRYREARTNADLRVARDPRRRRKKCTRS